MLGSVRSSIRETHVTRIHTKLAEKNGFAWVEQDCDRTRFAFDTVGTIPFYAKMPHSIFHVTLCIPPKKKNSVGSSVQTFAVLGLALANCSDFELGQHLLILDP